MNHISGLIIPLDVPPSQYTVRLAHVQTDLKEPTPTFANAQVSHYYKPLGWIAHVVYFTIS
jgi:hypothetical protein